jgi:hypothetical protein
MSHGAILDRINFKQNFIKQHKPRWYDDNEDRLQTFDEHLDHQVKRIGKKVQQKGYKPPFRLELPEGMKAAERGH